MTQTPPKKSKTYADKWFNPWVSQWVATLGILSFMGFGWVFLVLVMGLGWRMAFEAYLVFTVCGLSLRTVMVALSRRQRFQEIPTNTQKIIGGITFQDLTEFTEQGIAILLGDRPIYANPALLKMLDLKSLQEFQSHQSYWSFFPPEEIQRLMAQAQHNNAQGLDVPVDNEVRTLKKSGEALWIDTKRVELKQYAPDLYLITLIDVTARKQAEEALRESEERYRLMFEESNMGLLLQTDLKPMMINQAFVDLLGYANKEEILSMPNVAPLVAPHEIPRIRQYTENRIRGLDAPSEYELQAVRKDGKPIWVNAHSQVIDWKGKKAVIGSFYDITARKWMEEELRKSEEKYLRMVMNFPGWTLQFKRREDGSFSVISMFGRNLNILPPLEWSRLEADGTAMLEIIHPEDREQVWKMVSDSAATLKPFHAEVRYLDRNNEVHWTQINSRPTLETNGEILWDGMMIDVTNRRKLEDEMIRLQKLESVSLLAEGIAHDFNNILTTLNGHLYLAHLDAESLALPQITDPLSLAMKSLEQARGLTHQLLTFAKGGTPVMEPTPIQEILGDAITFSLRGSPLVSHLDLPLELMWVQVDRSQILQVFNNLIINAIQAMPQGGNLWVSAQNTRVDETQRLANLADGDYVHVTFRDDGPGISEEVIHKVFDPYFTTKSYGTGLGLTICSSILKKHAGWMSVTAKPGRGTVFDLYLPSVAPGQLASPEKPHRDFSGRRLLVVDSDAEVLGVLRKLLERLGLETAGFNQGPAAVEAYIAAHKAGKPFDGVMMDLSIRRDKGRDTLIQLLEFDRNAKCIVTSGFAQDPVMVNHQDYGFKARLNKPFHLHELTEVLAHVLGGRPSRGKTTGH